MLNPNESQTRYILLGKLSHVDFLVIRIIRKIRCQVILVPNFLEAFFQMTQVKLANNWHDISILYALLHFIVVSIFLISKTKEGLVNQMNSLARMDNLFHLVWQNSLKNDKYCSPHNDVTTCSYIVRYCISVCFAIGLD